MDFINPSIKTYKEVFNESIEDIDYFYDNYGYVRLKKNRKVMFSMKEFNFKCYYDKRTGLLNIFLTSCKKLYFNRERECISIDFIKLILNFEVDDDNICWYNTDSEDSEDED